MRGKLPQGLELRASLSSPPLLLSERGKAAVRVRPSCSRLAKEVAPGIASGQIAALATATRSYGLTTKVRSEEGRSLGLQIHQTLTHSSV